MLTDHKAQSIVFTVIILQTPLSISEMDFSCLIFGQVLQPCQGCFIKFFAHSAGQDQTAPQSDLGLHCLLEAFCPNVFAK